MTKKEYDAIKGILSSFGETIDKVGDYINDLESNVTTLNNAVLDYDYKNKCLTRKVERLEDIIERAVKQIYINGNETEQEWEALKILREGL